MPPYKFLFETPLDYRDVKKLLVANQGVGVPYSADQVTHAREDLEAQADPNADGGSDFQKRYAKAQVRDFDGDADHITEGDALIAYLQMLGTLVDFKSYQAQAPEHRR